MYIAQRSDQRLVHLCTEKVPVPYRYIVDYQRFTTHRFINRNVFYLRLPPHIDSTIIAFRVTGKPNRHHHFNNI